MVWKGRDHGNEVSSLYFESLYLKKDTVIHSQIKETLSIMRQSAGAFQVEECQGLWSEKYFQTLTL